MVRDASHSDAEVLLGVVNDKRWKKRVGVTLVATGIRPEEARSLQPESLNVAAVHTMPGTNGHSLQPQLATRKLF